MLKLKIIEMLKENTGTNMLDSGSAYGRNWERNALKDFEKEKPISFEDGCLNRSLYWYLVENLEITEDSKRLNAMFETLMNNSEECYLTDMEDFADMVNIQDGYLCDKPLIDNSYNSECCLSQTIQFSIFHRNDKYFIILQVHNGCDVRGGYTKPYIFELPNGADSFILWNNADITYNGVHMWTDDGYNFYNNENNKTIVIDELNQKMVVV